MRFKVQEILEMVENPGYSEVSSGFDGQEQVTVLLLYLVSRRRLGICSAQAIPSDVSKTLITASECPRYPHLGLLGWYKSFFATLAQRITGPSSGQDLLGVFLVLGLLILLALFIFFELFSFK